MYQINSRKELTEGHPFYCCFILFFYVYFHVLCLSVCLRVDVCFVAIIITFISVSNLYQNWIKTVSKLCLIQFWYSFSVSNLYQKLFDIILIVSNLYQNCIKCVSEVWYNLILSNRYQNCIKSDFVTFDSIKTVSNQTLSLLTLSKLYQIRLCHFWLYQNCIKSDFVIFWLYQNCIKSNFVIFWLYLNCIKSDFIIFNSVKFVSNQTL